MTVYSACSYLIVSCVRKESSIRVFVISVQ